MRKEIQKQDSAFRSLIGEQKLKPSASYRRSIYCVWEEKDGNTVLFHTLTTQCVLLRNERFSDSVFSAETVEKDPQLFWLMQRYFLVPVDFQDEAFYRSTLFLLRKRDEKEGYFKYTILPTTGCNARCVYCFEQGYRIVSMSEETAKQAVRFILDTKRDRVKITLSWFGGEPLTRPQIIDAISRRLTEEGVDFRSSIVTNGSLIDDSVLSKMLGLWKTYHVQISMEGDEAVYRSRKQYPVYGNQYFDILKNAEILAKNGIQVLLGCNVDSENADRIPDFVADAARMIPDKEKVRIAFPQLFASRMSDREAELHQKIIEADRYLLQSGFPPNFDGFPDRMKLYGCMADGRGREIVIAPDGKLYACEHCEEDKSFGNIWDGVTDRERWDAMGRIDSGREKCRNCPYLPLCTPFSGCSVSDYGCREMHAMNLSLGMRNALANDNA